MEGIDDLLAMSSIDARVGIRRLGGKAGVYRRQLQRFHEHYRDAATELRRLIIQQGLDAAGAYCHALKGVTGNLAAMALHEQFSLLYDQLSRGETPDEGLLSQVETSLKVFAGEVGRLAVPPAPTFSPLPALDERGFADLLDRLAQALEYDLGAAGPLLDTVRAGVAGTPHEDAIARVAARAEVFDIDAALEILRELQTTLKTATGNTSS